MSHRALQIVDAVKATLEADTTLAANVYKHRAASLSEEDAELPAVSITLGEDVPSDTDGAGNMAYLDSFLELGLTLYAVASHEEGAITELMRLRSEVHRNLMADRQQGLAWVMDTRFGGAGAPEVSPQGGRFTGRMETRWTVFYRMVITDPDN